MQPALPSERLCKDTVFIYNGQVHGCDSVLGSTMELHFIEYMGMCSGKRALSCAHARCTMQSSCFGGFFFISPLPCLQACPYPPTQHAPTESLNVHNLASFASLFFLRRNKKALSLQNVLFSTACVLNRLTSFFPPPHLRRPAARLREG